MLEQFSAEPPFGGSSLFPNTLFNTPFFSGRAARESQSVHAESSIRRRKRPAAVDTPGSPNGCVDWSTFRPLLLFGEFQPHLKSQYSEQYNLTIERQLSKDMLLRVAYVGTQSHHLLASHDLNRCEYANLPGNRANRCKRSYGPACYSACGPGGGIARISFRLRTAMARLYLFPTFTPPAQPFKAPARTCNGLPCHTTRSRRKLHPGRDRLEHGLRRHHACRHSGHIRHRTASPIRGLDVRRMVFRVFSNIFAEDTIANSNYNAIATVRREELLSRACCSRLPTPSARPSIKAHRSKTNSIR